MIALAFALFRWVEIPGKGLILKLTAFERLSLPSSLRSFGLRRPAPLPSTNG